MRFAAAVVWSAQLCLAIATACVTLVGSVIDAQSAPAKIDTVTLSANGRAVFRVWNSYLISRAGKRAQRSDTPSPYWLLAEQKRWSFYDMAASYLDDDAEPQTVSVVRANPQSD
ncbi:MAG: hypothetical protein ABI852_13170, partial [Gemmatimonadaceae bacterium]